MTTATLRWHPGETAAIARTRMRVTQAQFAAMLRDAQAEIAGDPSFGENMSDRLWTQPTVSELENRKFDPTFGEILALAKVTGLPLDAFYKGLMADSVIPGSIDSLSVIPEGVWNQSIPTFGEYRTPGLFGPHPELWHDIAFREQMIDEAVARLRDEFYNRPDPDAAAFRPDPNHMRFRLFNEPIPYDRREQVA